MSLGHRMRKLFTRPYGSVRPLEAHDLVGQGAVLLDVRERAEWKVGHAPRARHIPLSELGRRLREVPEGRHIVTVCRSGARSASAARLLSREGRTVSNLSGGMTAWARAGLPVVANGGRPGGVA